MGGEVGGMVDYLSKYVVDTSLLNLSLPTQPLFLHPSLCYTHNKQVIAQRSNNNGNG